MTRTPEQLVKLIYDVGCFVPREQWLRAAARGHYCAKDGEAFPVCVYIGGMDVWPALTNFTEVRTDATHVVFILQLENSCVFPSDPTGERRLPR